MTNMNSASSQSCNLLLLVVNKDTIAQVLLLISMLNRTIIPELIHICHQSFLKKQKYNKSTHSTTVLQLWSWQYTSLHLCHCVAYTDTECLQKWVGIEVGLVNLKNTSK